MRTAFGAICFKLGIALGVFYFLVVAYARSQDIEGFPQTISVSESLKISAIPVIIGAGLALVF